MKNKYNYARDRMMQASNTVESLAKRSPESKENHIQEMVKRAER